MDDTVSISFSLEDLWLLQSVVRHEQSPAWIGHWPITSVELNDTIAEAINFCVEEKVKEAYLELSKGDLYLLDAVVPQGAKDVNGAPIGKNILLKTFAARQKLRGSIEATAPEPAPIDMKSKLKEWETVGQLDYQRFKDQHYASTDYDPYYHPDYLSE